MNGADEALTLALSRPGRLAGTRLVCIDGPAGSGKTTLATALARQAVAAGLSVEVVHTDDLLDGWAGLPRLGERVSSQIVVPLAAGVTGCYDRYDWHAERFADRVLVPVSDLLVLEGVGSGDPSYAELVTALVWVEAPRDLRLRRGIARDGEELRERWLEWMPAEDALHREHRTRERADLRVRGV